MTGVSILLLALRWLHILGGITLMGGALFQRLALMPSAAELPDDAHNQLKEALRGRWSKVVMAMSSVLLMSGMASYVVTTVNFQFDKGELPGKLYHMLFGIKFLLGLIVLGLAAMLSGRSSAAQRMRANAANWLTINLLLATLVVMIGGFMRYAPRSLKQPAAAATSASERPGAASDFAG
jgi:uncharacterized membrane protein